MNECGQNLTSPVLPIIRCVMRWRHKHVEILIRCGHSDHYISASLVPSGKLFLLFFSKIVTFFSDTII
ncbi:hypothetical protein DERP_013443 [Dermatophagoides pteronyssinus]|uniref:Uncharacterized protein n=1 Tax=Dermatophagoides pteronyssinus TaxID=6956 RepID=A0ABQ8JRH6_DERPT|nr:hypothetical protein DERP_013443 [Dermatophagoides pteronyssinus]